jgi:hypothetical protein
VGRFLVLFLALSLFEEERGGRRKVVVHHALFGPHSFVVPSCALTP